MGSTVEVFTESETVGGDLTVSKGGRYVVEEREEIRGVLENLKTFNYNLVHVLECGKC